MSDLRKARSMDEVLGEGMLDVPEPVLSKEEGEILTHKSSFAESKKNLGINICFRNG